MEKKKRVLMGILIIIIILILGTILYLMFNKTKYNYEDYIYKIHYFEDYVPGYNHDIYFLKDKKIKVISNPGCSIPNCKVESKTTYVNFSNKNIEIIWNWAKNIMNNTNYMEILSSNIDNDTKNIIDSIIYNNEKYLDKSNTTKYKEIHFKDYKIINNDLEIIKEQSFKLKIKDHIIYINNVKTNIQNDYDEFYVVDIDNDNIKEIITRTTTKDVSPFTNNYHIYKYFTDNNYFEEIVTISIMGSINSFYVNGPDIKVVYNPFEPKEDYIEEKHYQFISEDYEISIKPIYLYQTPNSLILYKNNYLITKSFDTSNYKNMIHHFNNYYIDINAIKNNIIKQDLKEEYLKCDVTEIDGKLEEACYVFYAVKFKNDDKEYYLNKDSSVLNDIINKLNYTDQIWYVN
ncbi:MAG: hypothetical protein IJO32_01130 [Bacilli bacterium]|nr:hypothetical protein [Bacilli bacterium]